MLAGVTLLVCICDLGFLQHCCYSCNRFRIVFQCLHNARTILVLSAFFPLLCLSALLQLLPSQFVYLAPFAPFFELRTVIVTLLWGGGFHPSPASVMLISISEPSSLGGSIEYNDSPVSSVAVAVSSSKITPHLVSLSTPLN